MQQRLPIIHGSMPQRAKIRHPFFGDGIVPLYMNSIRPCIFVATLLLTGPGYADQPETTDAAGPGVWWSWDVSREWSSNHRRANGVIKMFSDAEKTQPLVVESLRFFLELDCPVAVGPELVINEMRDASELGGEVRCTVGSPGKFEVRWRFEAVDARFGSVDDQGTVPK
jgi:hypothetical protein